MTTGQTLFFSGIALLMISIGLTILFVVKKPRYHPENEAFVMESSGTQKRVNGYPTDPLTIRRDSTGKTVGSTARKMVSADETEWMSRAVNPAEETLPLIKTVSPGDETLLLRSEQATKDGTVLLEETEMLADESVLQDTTAML